MKKFLGLFLMLTMVALLTACRNNEVICEDNQELIDGVCVDIDITPPVLSGVTDVTIYIDEDFDPMEGVTAIDDVDGDITDQISLTGTYNTSRVGTYFLRYTVEDSAGNRTERTRYLTVTVDPDLIGDMMVPNGDFSLGWAIWTSTTGLEGGNASFEVVNEELKIEITGAASAGWEPRLENQNITFEQGKLYQLSFEARAVDARAIRVQIGELLPSAPWFVPFTGATVFDLSNTMEEYTFTFLMDSETNERGSLLFEFGQVASPSGNNNYLTTVYLDNVVIVEVDPDDIVDDVPPSFMGLDDATVFKGDDFDPLEGVTANDNIDGDIPLTLDNVSGTLDTDTVGEYILTYTVSDAAGNVTIETRTITVIEPIVVDGPKPADYGWRGFYNFWDDGAAAEIEVVDGELVFTATGITSIGAEENYKLQIIQDAFAYIPGAEDNEGSMQFVAGETYRITFDARATVAGEAVLAIGHSVGGWNPYFVEAFDVTADMQTFTFTFVADDDAIDYSVLAQFKIEFGLLFADEDAPQSFILDNVLIEVEANGDYVDAELIVNGVFEEEEVFEGSIFGWRGFFHNSGGEVSFVNGRLMLNLLSNSASQNWHIQVIQDAYALGTGLDNKGSFNFEAGKTYRLTFDASTSIDGNIHVAIGHLEGGWHGYLEQEVTVTTELDTYVVEFTLDDDSMDYSVPAQLKFEMGALFAGQGIPQSFTLDNVLLEVKDGDNFVDAEMVVNGQFDMVIED